MHLLFVLIAEGEDITVKIVQRNGLFHNRTLKLNQIPAAKRGNVNLQESSDSTELVDRLVARNPSCVITIGGKDIGCIIDTGAEASIIPSSLYHTQLKDNVGELHQPDGIFLSVVGVGGIQVPIDGYIEVPIEVRGQKLLGSFLVVKDEACIQMSPILQKSHITRL